MMKILGEDVLVKNLTAGYVNGKLAQQEEKAGTTNERITRFKALIRWVTTMTTCQIYLG